MSEWDDLKKKRPTGEAKLRYVDRYSMGSYRRDTFIDQLFTVGDRLQSENKELGVTIIQQACKLEVIKNWGRCYVTSISIAGKEFWDIIGVEESSQLEVKDDE